MSLIQWRDKDVEQKFAAGCERLAGILEWKLKDLAKISSRGRDLTEDSKIPIHNLSKSDLWLVHLLGLSDQDQNTCPVVLRLADLFNFSAKLNVQSKT